MGEGCFWLSFATIISKGSNPKAPLIRPTGDFSHKGRSELYDLKRGSLQMNPIVFTDAAVTHIKSMLAKNHSIGFRLSIKKTGCSGYAYVPDIIEKAIDSDIHFVAQDDLQVFVDPNSLQYLQDIVVDYVVEEGHGLKQKRLNFINPKEKGRCGCGESFTIE
jgi:iron-sulfur cluster assembly protein